jgi:GT2 family glycosyltransferase
MIMCAWSTVGIILVNWKAWRNTVECLESLRGPEYTNISTYVVDNDSADGSAERPDEWDHTVRVIPSGGSRGRAGGCKAGKRVWGDERLPRTAVRRWA